MRAGSRATVAGVAQPVFWLPAMVVHGAVCLDHTDHAIIGVGHVDVAIRIHRDALRIIEFRLESRPIQIARHTIAGHGRNNASGITLWITLLPVSEI